ncbi:hypothetical protein HG531_005378 [Fusarium graminearum]|nr:hypothetical protein HG531_005378 [Fusarium graminearum]
MPVPFEALLPYAIMIGMFGISGTGLAVIKGIQNEGKRPRYSVDQWDRPHLIHLPKLCFGAGGASFCFAFFVLTGRASLNLGHLVARSSPVGRTTASNPLALIATAACPLALVGCKTSHVLSAPDNVQDCAWPHLFEILDKSSSRASESLWAVYTLGAEVVQLLVVCIKNNLLLVSILERLASHDLAARVSGNDAGTSR